MQGKDAMYYDLNTLFYNPRNGDRIVCYNADKPISFNEFASMIAGCFEKASAIKSDECVLYAHDDFLFTIGFFALLLAGKKIILPANLAKGTLVHIKASAILSDADPGCCCDMDFVDLSIIKAAKARNLPQIRQDAQIAFFTSGSTGTPKRIMKTFASLKMEVEELERTLKEGFNEKTTVISTVNSCHIYGMLYQVLLPFYCGAAVDMALIASPEELDFRLKKYDQPTFVSSPAFLDRLVNYRESYSFPKKPIMVTSSGGLLSERSSSGINEILSCSPVEIFGSTETGGVAYRAQAKDKNWRLFDTVKASTDEDGRIVVTSQYLDDKPFVMEDAVEFVSDKTFILKGRLDRMVKFEEKRVSLPEIEQRVAAHEMIAKAYALVVPGRKKSIGACLSLNAAGRKFIVAKGKKALITVLHDYLKDYMGSFAIPTKWRILDEIPMNAQGKILVKDIERVFENNIAEPIVTGKNVYENNANLSLFFLGDSIYFNGHFPEFALLPAVIQIHFAVHFAEKFWGFKAKNMNRMSRLKFSNVIKPDTPVTLELERKESGIDFKYHIDGKACSSGSIAMGRNNAA